MINLNPPFPILKIGLLRKIELYNDSEGESILTEYDYLLETERVKAIFDKDCYMFIIGSVDYSHGILIDKKQKVKGVFVDSILEKGKLNKIADSPSHFYNALKLIENIWNGKENKIGLEKNSINIASRDSIINQIQNNNPKSDIAFWNYYVFRELNIGLY